MNKAEFQKEALDSIINHNSNCIFTAATGVGKSKVAIDYLKHCMSQILYPKFLIVVPTEKLRDENFKPLEQLTLEPYERDHAVVTGIYRPAPEDIPQE